MSAKPILKKSSLSDVPVVPTTASNDPRRHMKWDEDNLRENAEYMEANPKMKIDEPDTPFVEYNIDNDAEMQEDERREQMEGVTHEVNVAEADGNLQARLVMAGARLQDMSERQECEPDLSQGSSHTDPPPQPCTPPQKSAAEQHDEEFKLKRKAVYADEGAKYVSIKPFPPTPQSWCGIPKNKV